MDISFQYLSFFEEDDALLDRLAQEYREGKLLSGELKKMCIAKLQEFVAGFQTVSLLPRPLSQRLSTPPSNLPPAHGSDKPDPRLAMFCSEERP